MEVERNYLLTKGYEARVVETMLASRKLLTHKIYNRTWQKFMDRGARGGVDTKSPSIPMILEFLQAGLDQGLSTNTVR